MQNGHSSPSSHRKTGEGRRLTGGGQSGHSEPPRRPEVRGRGAGMCASAIPGLTLGWGGAQRRGDGSGRRWLWWCVAAALALGRSGLEAAEAVVRRLRSSGSLYSRVKAVQWRWPVRGVGGAR